MPAPFSTSLLSLLLFHRIAPRAHRVLSPQIGIRPGEALRDQAPRGETGKKFRRRRTPVRFGFQSAPSFQKTKIYLSFILFLRRCSASWCLEAYVVDMRDSPDGCGSSRRRLLPQRGSSSAVRGAAGAEAAAALRMRLWEERRERHRCRCARPAASRARSRSRERGGELGQLRKEGDLERGWSRSWDRGRGDADGAAVRRRCRRRGRRRRTSECACPTRREDGRGRRREVLLRHFEVR